MNGRSLFKKANKFINLLVSFIRFIPYPIRINLLFSLRNVGGKFGISLRYLFIKTICFECGDNVVIYSNVFINSPKNLSLGSNISIHPMCYIDATGGVSIGDNVSIAHSSTILSTTHTYSDFSSPIKYNNIKETYTVINNDVWIGCGSRILAGVNIGYRNVIAANSVVNKSTESKSLYGGVPAKKIKDI